ncbi:MAG: DEAD/DEAH box helicase family protein, partial [Candidatus Pacebacteria bacterium]|nr:DEAD/DEAH box helicase family protein [Candidatus Paceibacterota bacterium]
MQQFLYEKFDNLSEAEVFDKFSCRKKPSDSLVCLEKNFAENIQLRDYQVEAFARFFYYFEKYGKKNYPIHLLFNMATGSGKTLMMAGFILYIYKKGYRNFLFFVDTVNIIDKTKANFLKELNSSKYLFADNIFIDKKKVEIKEVSNFNDVNEKNINIKFTTINGLHRDLTNIKENSITFDDFENYKIVMLADEVHHLDSATKNKQKALSKNLETKGSWENTVEEILNKNGDNILLGFTATVDLNNSDIKEKYLDKIIYKYDLKEFRKDRFSKEIKNISLDTKKYEDLMLQAIILSQYRLKLAEKRLGIFFKPVILFKAQKTIDQSRENLKIFTKLIGNLIGSEIEKIYKILTKDFDSGKLFEDKNETKELFEKVFNFFGKTKKDFEKLAKELKRDFGQEKVLFTNNKSKETKSLSKSVKEDLEKTQKLLNSLEDKNNLIRAIFTVNKLNEGWDVLNLFDIARLYNTRDEKHDGNRNRTAGKTTISEVQLIGRGARYNPFSLPEQLLASNIKDEKMKRKFDDDEENELRILEEFYYHAKYNHRYINELQNELINQGLRDEKEKVKITLKLKEDFQKTNLYKTGTIFVNKRILKDKTKITSFESLKFDTKISTNFSKTKKFFDAKKIENTETIDKQFDLEFFGKNIIKKAIIRNGFFAFKNINFRHFPILKSIDDLRKNKKFLPSLEIFINSTREELKNISDSEKLEIFSDILSFLENRIKENYSEYEGSEKFAPKEVKQVFKKEHS